jgi:Phage integrase family
VSRNRVAEVVKTAAARAKAPDVRYHDLRHFYASALIRKGLSVKVVQARLKPPLSRRSACTDTCGRTTRTAPARPSTAPGRRSVDELLGGELAEDWLRTGAGE